MGRLVYMYVHAYVRGEMVLYRDVDTDFARIGKERYDHLGAFPRLGNLAIADQAY